MASNPPRRAAAAATRQLSAGFRTGASAAGLPTQIGKEAIAGMYRAQVQTAKGTAFTGSTDIDSHFKDSEPNSPRWDYGIGIRCADGQELVCWVEAHPASSTAQAEKMLSKLAWLKAKLKSKEFSTLQALTHPPGRAGHAYYWLRTEGGCRIAANSKEAKLLAMRGLRMPAPLVTLP